MVNGIGPMGLVKNNMSYSLFPNKRTYRLPDDYAARSGAIMKGAELTEDGILTFATAHKQVNVSNWNAGQQVPDDSRDLANMRQTCIDYAPFLFKQKISEEQQARASLTQMADLRQSPAESEGFFDKQ